MSADEETPDADLGECERPVTRQFLKRTLGEFIQCLESPEPSGEQTLAGNLWPPTPIGRTARRREQRRKSAAARAALAQASEADTLSESEATSSPPRPRMTYGGTWTANMEPLSFAGWARAQDVMHLLRVLRRTRFAVAEQRDQALGAVDALGVSEVVGSLLRFPETGQWVNTDEMTFSMTVNKLRSCLGYKDPVSDRGGRAGADAESLNRGYNDAARGFVAALNEMQSYLTNSANLWTRHRFEAYHALTWA